ncbi:MAG: AzlC family ABC transporter permease [Bacteroidales bacterium]|nr:AzlC family ABC transporter permease [Bacteroidales bacterium]
MLEIVKRHKKPTSSRKHRRKVTMRAIRWKQDSFNRNLKKQVRDLAVVRHLTRYNAMKRKASQSNEFVRGLMTGKSIGLGYVPVSFTFGLVAVQMGFDPWVAVFISLTNLASAGQFAGIRMISGGAAAIELAMTTIVVNIRYFLMSLSLTQKIDTKMPIWKRCIMAFGVTDEIFALAAMEKKDVSFPFFGGLMTCPIVGWTLGTFLGAFAAGLMPPMVQACMGIALYCMFIAIIIPPSRTNKDITYAILIASALSCLFKYVPFINKISQNGGGWSLIVSAIGAAAICATFFKTKEQTETETGKEVLQ